MSKSFNKPLLKLAMIAITGLPVSASACGSDPFLGEICTFTYNFCPRGYLEAAGQTLSIQQNTALFSLLGTQYGGDGVQTFALPDLRGRSPIGDGQGPGLSPIQVGEETGSEFVTILPSQMPAHNHTAQTNVLISASINAVSTAGNTTNPSGKVLATSASRDNLYSNATPNASLDPGAISASASATTTVGISGGSQPLYIRSPVLGVKYCVATQGIFPSRN
ncbi:phage tail protein [Methylomonas rosea]|uniref:Tail fiber protein n=1 Tax=Methylomonas rosea TaxID=2952227 RepID=A0ABT1TRB5_9GAMM|nr:tail fiber protein [Methylomonas sp. WSC-7]MCQ8117314.1 tail fiber protein [Methylomonas sp. WSC-7]